MRRIAEKMTPKNSSRNTDSPSVLEHMQSIMSRKHDQKKDRKVTMAHLIYFLSPKTDSRNWKKHMNTYRASTAQTQTQTTETVTNASSENCDKYTE